MQPVAGIGQVEAARVQARWGWNVWWHLPALHTCCHRGWNRVEPVLLVSGRSVPRPSGTSGAWAGVAAGVQCMQQAAVQQPACRGRACMGSLAPPQQLPLHCPGASWQPPCLSLTTSHLCLLPHDQPHLPISNYPAWLLYQPPSAHPALIHSGWPWSVRRSTHFTPPFTSSAPAAQEGPGPAAAAGRMTVNAGRGWAAVRSKAGGSMLAAAVGLHSIPRMPPLGHTQHYFPHSPATPAAPRAAQRH